MVFRIFETLKEKQSKSCNDYDQQLSGYNSDIPYLQNNGIESDIVLEERKGNIYPVRTRKGKEGKIIWMPDVEVRTFM